MLPSMPEARSQNLKLTELKSKNLIVFFESIFNKFPKTISQRKPNLPTLRVESQGSVPIFLERVQIILSRFW